MYIYELSKQDIKLSKAEVMLLGKVKSSPLIQNYLFIEKNIDFKRLAYTKKVYKVLFSSSCSKLKERLEKFDFNKVYKKSFALKIINKGDCEKELADIIYRRIKNPKVDLRNAKTKIAIIFLRKKAYVGLLIWENKEDFNARKPHKRPELHPSSLNPRLARAMVNMASADQILDPFCGSGGILIEGGLLGLKVMGYDIDRIMVNRAKINLKHFKIRARVEQKDARKLKGRYKAIVTDPPYSKNTKDVELEKLYFEFLKNAEKVSRKIVISFPDFLKYKKIIGKTKWRIKHNFSYYIHKSMSKAILVLTL